jgi:hypothetical protein
MPISAPPKMHASAIKLIVVELIMNLPRKAREAVIEILLTKLVKDCQVARQEPDSFWSDALVSRP